MLAALTSVAGGFLNKGGGQPAGPVRQSQDGNTLNSGTGAFTVGGVPAWAWVAGGVVLLVALLAAGWWLLKRKQT